jgi:hypothetical protein
MWDARIKMGPWLLVSALIGIGLALVQVGWDWKTDASRIAAERMGIPAFHIQFPASAVIYPAGAIIVEVFYRLVPLPLFVFLISNLLLRARAQN